jgi:hypothetical protein
MTVVRQIFFSLVLFVSALPVAALAQAPALDPLTLKQDITGPRSQLLVIGTAHLGQMKEGPIKPAYLALLLDRLAAYKPTIITVEGLSGQSCDLFKRYAALYPGVADTYCRATEDAEKATGLAVPQAAAEAARLLSAWPAAPTAAQRRHLAAVFLAANDRPSALVQWLRLPAEERRAGDGLDARLTALLGELVVKPSEHYQISAVLAARLGLERLYLADDHLSDSITAPLGAPFDAALKEIWSAPDAERAVDDRVEAAAMKSADGLLAFYRYMNTPQYQLHAIGHDFALAAKHQSPQLYGRQYVAWWETRNLRMVASIREAMASQPGARVLSIVGASHKPYFEAYLNLMHDVQLVDALAILK